MPTIPDDPGRFKLALRFSLAYLFQRLCFWTVQGASNMTHPGRLPLRILLRFRIVYKRSLDDISFTTTSLLRR